MGAPILSRWPDSMKTSGRRRRKTTVFSTGRMRVALGLSSPDLWLGCQTAHDFTQSLGAARVVLSRAKEAGRFADGCFALPAAHGGARRERRLAARRRARRPVARTCPRNRPAGARSTPIKRPRPTPALSYHASGQALGHAHRNALGAIPTPSTPNIS